MGPHYIQCWDDDYDGGGSIEEEEEGGGRGTYNLTWALNHSGVWYFLQAQNFTFARDEGRERHMEK